MRRYGYFFAFAYLLLIAVIWILPFYSFTGYSLVANSVDELGAQNVPRAWIMNITIALQSLATFTLGMQAYKLKSIQLIILSFFSIAFFLTSYFQLAGNETARYLYSYTQDTLHSIFAIVSGFAFCLFCLLLILALKFDKHRVQTSIVIIVILALSYLIFEFPEMVGLFQRILYMIAFGWLFIAIIQYPLREKGESY